MAYAMYRSDVGYVYGTHVCNHLPPTHLIVLTKPLDFDGDVASESVAGTGIYHSCEYAQPAITTGILHAG
jgi:hypothetical protein